MIWDLTSHMTVVHGMAVAKFHWLATQGSMSSLVLQDHIANPTGANIITNFGFGN